MIHYPHRGRGPPGGVKFVCGTSYRAAGSSDARLCPNRAIKGGVQIWRERLPASVLELHACKSGVITQSYRHQAEPLRQKKVVLPQRGDILFFDLPHWRVAGLDFGVALLEDRVRKSASGSKSDGFA